MSDEIVNLVLGVVGYTAECELKNLNAHFVPLSEARKNIGLKPGRKRQFDKYQVSKIMEKRHAGHGYGKIAKSLGMNRSTVQKIVQRELGLI